jgi:hypothetical protein
MSNWRKKNLLYKVAVYQLLKDATSTDIDEFDKLIKCHCEHTKENIGEKIWS